MTQFSVSTDIDRPYLRQSNQKRSARRALTLVEVVVSTLLVSTMLVSSLYTSLAMTKSYSSITDRSKSILLAERYLTEVLQSSYADPLSPTFGLESGESNGTRIFFDDVDDYHGRIESPPTTKSGDTLPDYGSDWSVSISVSRVNPIDPRLNNLSETGLKRIAVTVTNPQGTIVKLVGLRSSTGGKDLTLKRNASYVQWIGLSLRAEGSGRPLHTGTQTMNLSETP